MMRSLKMLKIRKRSEWVALKEECFRGSIGCEEGQEDQARTVTVKEEGLMFVYHC